MKEQTIKAPEEFLSRGTGNFINCTDYDDAVQAIKDYHAQFSISAEVERRIEERMKKEGLPKNYAELKDICCKFFRYWWNTGGTNTDDGFDEWFRNRIKGKQ